MSSEEIPDADEFDNTEIIEEVSAKTARFGKIVKTTKVVIDGEIVYKRDLKPKPILDSCKIYSCTQCGDGVMMCMCHWNGIQVFTLEAICGDICLDEFLKKWRDQYVREWQRAVWHDTRAEMTLVKDENKRKIIEMKVDNDFRERVKDKYQDRNNGIFHGTAGQLKARKDQIDMIQDKLEEKEDESLEILNEVDTSLEDKLIDEAEDEMDEEDDDVEDSDEDIPEAD